MHFISFILKNLTRRPVRTALTVLGLAVAIGTMIALLGMSHNFEASLRESFEKRGVDLVIVAGGAPDQLSSELDESLLDQVRLMPEVEALDAALVDLTEMYKREPRDANDIPPSMQVIVQAWLPENFGYDDLDIIAGRALNASDAGHHRAMLGKTMAENLKKTTGDTITILQQPFEVVGVYKSSNVFENGGVITLLKDYQELSGRKDVVTGFSIRVRKTSGNDEADIEAVRQKILALKDRHGKPARLSVESPQNYLDKAGHLLITKAMAWMVSVIAIIIGVISMLNTMVMSVLERTHEIGILRAVGWTRGRVIRMILGESAFLGLFSAVAGAIGAIAVTYVLAQMPKVNGFIEGGIALSVIVQGVLIAVVIGILGGAYPAIRAARLLPTEAIRHE